MKHSKSKQVSYTALRQGISALALFTGFASNVALAQSSTGSIYGKVATPDGSTIKLENLDTGASKELPVDRDGSYTFSALPGGNYRVSLEKSDQIVASKEVKVSPGLGSSANFDAAAATTQLAGVNVTAAAVNPIDVSTAQTSTTFTAQQLREIPVAQNVVDVAKLTPGASAGAAVFGDLPSFNGSSVAENAYYVNGFNVTNLFKNLAYSNVPFEAVQDEQVIDGAYGPEYGRVTGGVISVTTKKGTNNWVGGGSVYWEPEAFQSSDPNVYYGCTSVPDSPCGVVSNGDANGSHDMKANLYLGGPLIKNKLFIYAIAQQDLSKTKDVGTASNPVEATGGTGKDTTSRNPYYLVDLSWNITSRNTLELTTFNDSKTTKDTVYNNDYSSAGGGQFSGSSLGAAYNETGGSTYIAKFTTNPIDNLTASAQWGQLKSKRGEYAIAANGTYEAYDGNIFNQNQPGCPVVFGAPNGASTCWFIPGDLHLPNGQDTRRAGRADIDYKLDLGIAGRHDLKAGYDAETWSTLDGETIEGGAEYIYQTDPDIVVPVSFSTYAKAGVNSEAHYFADNWNVTDRVLLELGVRNDGFKNKNGVGETYVKQDNIWQPRLGVAWDIKGDSTMKAYASYGLYSLPITSSVAVRGASASIYSEGFYDYTGVDPVTGRPQLGDQVDPTIYFNAENGSIPNAASVTDKNLKPIQQEQYIVGFQAQVYKEWYAGVKGTYQNLKKTIDDFCSYLPLEQWAAKNGYTFSPGANTPGCFIINPGSGADLTVDIDGNGSYENVNLSSSDIGLPKAKRKDYSIELTLEKGWAQNWYMNASYVYGHNYGNTEGLVRSDIGQADTGTTEDFDYPLIEQGAYGNLPNDHRHTFKLLSEYRPIKPVTLAASLQVQTGSPESCLGYNPADATTDVGFGPGAGTYGTGAYNFCGGKEVPKGSVGYTDTYWNLDLSGEYKPSFVRGLSLTAAVFNVFDKQADLSVDQLGEIGPPNYSATQTLAGNSYLSPTSFQTPRYFRFGVRYDFSL